jgi:hypothetical protein
LYALSGHGSRGSTLERDCAGAEERSFLLRFSIFRSRRDQAVGGVVHADAILSIAAPHDCFRPYQHQRDLRPAAIIYGEIFFVAADARAAAQRRKRRRAAGVGERVRRVFCCG